jgi:hypothetical protein
MLILHCLNLPGGLLKTDGQMDPIICRPKDEVVDPRARSFELQAPLCQLPELDNHLPYNIHLEDFNGQVPKLRLSGRRHCRLERRKPHSHPGVVGSCKPHFFM